MNCKSAFLVLGLVAKVFSANFSVVSFDGDCKLSIGDKTYPMTEDPNCSNLFKTTVDVPINTKYKYICNGKEDVERTLKEENTHNELVGRSLTLYDMPEFGYPNAEPWNRTIGRTELFDPNYVPIVIIDDAKDFFVNAGGSSKFKKVTFILKDNVFTFKDVGTSSKNDDEDKFQFSVTLPDDDGIYHRNVFKFRPSAYDPVFFRQILYGDIAHAIGNPAHESVAARVYLNDGTGIGLYVLQEDVTSESFIRTAFYGNSDGSIKNYTKSVIYDCSTGADFDADEGNDLEAFQNDEEGDQKIELKEMTRKIDQVDISNTDQIKNLDDNWLDLDTLFRAIALEYLTGHWDSYWFLTSNFVTYHPAEETEGTEYNYSKYKYYFIDQDFDQTWSVGMQEKLNPTEFPTKQYTEFVGKSSSYWKDINSSEGEYEPGTRIIINKFLGCDGQDSCETKTLFESHLKSIVQHIFNPVAIGRKVDGYKERLDEEIKWDINLTRLFTGKKRIYQFTYDDFIGGIETGMTSSYGIMDWTKTIADTVCKQFNMEYDKVALTPETAKKEKVNPIDPGTKYDPASNLHSGSIMNRANVALILITSILSVILYI